MAAHPMVTSDHLSSLRYMTCGAAPLGKAVLKDLEKKAPGLMVADGKTNVIHGFSQRVKTGAVS